MLEKYAHLDPFSLFARSNFGSCSNVCKLAHHVHTEHEHQCWNACSFLFIMLGKIMYVDFRTILFLSFSRLALCLVMYFSTDNIRVNDQVSFKKQLRLHKYSVI